MNRTDKWTPADEAELQRLMRRKESLNEKHTAPLVKWVRKIGMDNTPISADAIAGTLILSADALRDMLEPFDSGVRQPMPADPGPRQPDYEPRK